MKYLKLAAAIMVAVGFITGAAHAQLGNPGSFSAAVNGTVTTNGVGTISLQNTSVISIQLNTVSNVANISNTVVSIDQSVDGSTWKSTGKTMTIANTGTVAANCVSNWTGLADLRWRINVQNGALDTVTNTVTIYYATKPGL